METVPTERATQGEVFEKSSLATFLTSMFGLLLVLHFVHLYARRVLESKHTLFDFNAEHNVPTMYQSLLWVFCACLAWRVFRSKERAEPWLWVFFAGVFLFLGVDEYGMIHDGLSIPLREKFDLTGALHFAWVIPYAILLLLLAPLAWKFVMAIPKRFRIKFCGAGSIYVLGALGVEMMGAGRHALHGREDLAYTVFTTIEEALEIIGLSAFAYFLYQFIEARHPNLMLSKKSGFLIVTTTLAILFAIGISRFLKHS